ncbi:SIR2 family protein [Williamsia muralis]|uniref:SIR2 family protein n=1 Tax=Williamsia marianensis TaxID=85044 RepID=UPI003803CF57
MTTSGLDDPYIPLAFSMYSTPGAYVVIAGAGVSMGANLPTAWGIVVELAKQFCRAAGDDAAADNMDAENVEKWYVDTFRTDLTYSGILERVAPTRFEREGVLRAFFEPMVEPSAAHHAVARLVVAGVVKVVVTMNFDHLFELALQAAGIDPIIVATEADAENVRPLQTIPEGSCLVVHLHGSYRDAMSMLNTSTELGSYGSHMQSLLDLIVRSHGLLIAGWSAQHDRALRDTVRREHRQFYTPGWINPGPLNAEAQTVADAIDAKLLEGTADDAFVRLADAVAAMRKRMARHPLTAAVVVERIKTDLNGDRPAITAHDTFTSEVGQLETSPALEVSDFQGPDYLERLAQIDEACQVPAAATAILARWGDATTDEWWLPVIEQWSHSFRASGNTTLIDLPLVVATRLFYAAGIGATVARRYDMLTRLFAIEVHGNGGLTEPACHCLAWDERHGDTQRVTTNPMREGLAAALGQALELSPARLDTVWQEFETLRTAAKILTTPELTERLAALREAESALENARAMANLGSAGGMKQAREDVDRSQGDIARLAAAERPHIFVEKTHTPGELNERPWLSPVARRLAKQPERFTKLGALAPATENRSDALAAALHGALTAFHLVAIAKDGYVSSRTEMWLDEPEAT